jgi:nucleotide-binding universal stress UspA family protein
MYKRILIAVDGSDTSDRALQEAINLAKDQQAMLSIVYAVDEVSLSADTEFVDPAMISNAWVEAGREILNKASNLAVAASVQAQTRLIELDHFGMRIADAIVEEAKAWSADIIVVGTHGRTGLSHLLLGSVAEDIVRASRLPVLLVHST